MKEREGETLHSSSSDPKSKNEEMFTRLVVIIK